MTEEHQPPPPGWEMSGFPAGTSYLEAIRAIVGGTSNWADYSNGPPLTAKDLGMTLKRAPEIILEGVRRLHEQEAARSARVDALLEGVDFDRLPLRAQHLVWMLRYGGIVGPRDAAWLEGELNEVRRPVD